MKEKIANSLTGYIYALLDNSIVFDRPQMTKQDLIDKIQKESSYRYDNEWLENIVDNAIKEWEKI